MLSTTDSRLGSHVSWVLPNLADLQLCASYDFSSVTIYAEKAADREVTLLVQLFSVIRSTEHVAKVFRLDR